MAAGKEEMFIIILGVRGEGRFLLRFVIVESSGYNTTTLNSSNRTNDRESA